MIDSCCPCGSQTEYSQCCGKYINNKQLAMHPEALMRSRYTAYTQANIDYIAKTCCGPAAEKFNYQTAKQWAEQVSWQALQVIRAYIDQADTNHGYVEFKAYYQQHGQKQCIHELSEFIKKNEQWYYYQGQYLPLPAQSTKIGRNDPCSCGSGKKFKKCCAATS
jgi:SEC-C motif-containing protein